MARFEFGKGKKKYNGLDNIEGLLLEKPHEERYVVARIRTVRTSIDYEHGSVETPTVNFEHIPLELLEHQTLGAAACDAPPMLDYAEHARWEIDSERIACPVRIVWGTEDRLLPWPQAAARYRRLLPHADWIELEGVGHCPQLDVPLETAQLILGA